MFTDIVGSVELQQKLGTEAYTRFVRRHDSIIKECLAHVENASILNETGDGFLVRFDDPSDAVNTALRLQFILRTEICENEPLRLRIGLHMGMVTEMEESNRGEKRVVGMAINLAARIMGIGGPQQILLTRAIYDDARHFVRAHPRVSRETEGELPTLQWKSHGTFNFKGHDEPVEIFEVGGEGVAPLQTPIGGESGKGSPGFSAGLTQVFEKPKEASLDFVKESDVYINFAPVDDRPLSPGQHGWISQFQRNLETRIEQLSGEAIKVTQRPPLEDEPAAGELIKAVPGAKAMVSVVSPPFVKSSNCIQEIETFWRSARDAGNLWLDDRTRLLKVVKTPVDERDLPNSLSEVFSDLLSFDFFTVDPDTGRLWEFDETFGVEARRRYYERVYDLAYELCHILKAFQGGQSQRVQKEDGQTVFLAETTGDLREARDRLKRELVERGHMVLPERPLPLSGPQLEAAVRDCIQRCTASVHLVGSVYGLVPEESEHSIVELQNRVVTQYLAEGPGSLSRWIWLPRERNEPEPRQAEFIRQLMEDPAALAGADLIESALEEFKEIMIEELAPAKKPERLAASGNERSEASVPFVYLICDRADEEAVEPLEDYLFDQGFEVKTPVFEGAESEIAALHRQNLLHCDAALIYYGHGSKGWVETKLMDLQQAPGYGRKQPIQAKVVYVAPPMDRRKQRFRIHQAEVVYSEENSNLELLSPFVSELKTKTNTAG
jgi:class 3 adenylate cyclase